MVNLMSDLIVICSVCVDNTCCHLYGLNCRSKLIITTQTRTVVTFMRGNIKGFYIMKIQIAIRRAPPMISTD